MALKLICFAKPRESLFNVVTISRKPYNKIFGIPRLIEEPGEISCGFRLDGVVAHMIQSCFLPGARRANALVLLDKGWSCQQVAHAFLLDDDTIRGWRKLDEEKQNAFIENYDNLLNSLTDNEAVVFADAVHPTHAARPVGCWAPSQEKLAIEQTSGRQRINIHGAIDL
jgi:hypothetical protein